LESWLDTEIARQSDPDVRAAPDPAAAAQRRPLEGLGVRMTAHRVVIGGRHPGPDEHGVLRHRAGGQIGAGLDQDLGADECVEVDARAAADNRSRSDDRTFADLGLVADDRARAGPTDSIALRTFAASIGFPNAISTSGLTLMWSLRLGRYFKRLQMFLGLLPNVPRFGFGDVPAENPRRPLTFVMHAQHDVRRLGDRKLEELHEGMNHEVFRRVVIVVEHNHVARRFLETRDGRFLPLLLRSFVGRGSHGGGED